MSSPAAYLVWFRIEDTTDELYRMAEAEDLDEVVAVIAAAGVPMDRVTITRPVSLKVSLKSEDTTDPLSLAGILPSVEVITAFKRFFDRMGTVNKPESRHGS